MLLIVRKKADGEILKKVAEDFNGYVKVVVDVSRQILSAGGRLHVDGEKLLLQDGSQQSDLWGGGIDFETGTIDFDSLINLRPGQGNTSREVLDQGIRKKMEAVIHGLLK